MTTERPRLRYEGPVLSGVTTTLAALGWGDRRASWWDDAARAVQLDGVSLVVDKGNGGSLCHPYLDPSHPLGGAPTTDYGLSRRDSLAKLDAVIFVADSQEARSFANTDRLARLESDLRYIGRDPERVPVVFQLNKRDLIAVAPPAGPASVLSCDALRATLPWAGPARYVPTIATRGEGVTDAVHAALEMLARADTSSAE